MGLLKRGQIITTIQVYVLVCLSEKCDISFVFEAHQFIPEKNTEITSAEWKRKQNH